MKEFEFDDIEVSDENEVKKEDKSDSLYQKFSFDIDDTDVDANKVFEQDVTSNINSLFDDEEEIKEEKPLFTSTNKDIDNPFKKEEKEEIEEVNVYEEANKNIKPIISFDEKEIESKEDALEEALSHTTKFTPFKEEKPSVNDSEIEEVKEGKESNGIAYLIALFVILLLAIFVIPKIASLL